MTRKKEDETNKARQIETINEQERQGKTRTDREKNRKIIKIIHYSL